MSLLFSQNIAIECERCSSTHFTISPIMQITTDKKEQHLVSHLMECVACGNKKIYDKDFFKETN